MSLYSEFQQIIDVLNREGVGYALCGGMAMAVYNLPRATMDIDLLILVQDLEKVRQLAKESGYTIDTGEFNIAGAGSKIYRMAKVAGEDEDPVVLDLLLADGELKDIWENRQEMEWDGGKLSVVSRDGLVRMKKLRGSRKDQDDIDFLMNNES
jgi:hypothetical protein